MTTQGLNTAAPIPAGKIYKDKMIWIGAFLGGPLVAGYIIAENFKSFGNRNAATKTWIFTILATLLIFAVAFLIPENTKGFERVIPITYTVIAASLLQHFQGKQLLSHIASGGQVYSWWRLLAISLIGLIVTLGTIFGSLLITEAISTDIKSKSYGLMEHEIMYDAKNISEAEIDHLAEAFTETTFFDDAVSKYVYVEKNGTDIEVFFSCNETIIDDPDAIEPFAYLQTDIQALYPDNKIIFNLVVDSYDNIVKRLE